MMYEILKHEQIQKCKAANNEHVQKVENARSFLRLCKLRFLRCLQFCCFEFANTTPTGEGEPPPKRSEGRSKGGGRDTNTKGRGRGAAPPKRSREDLFRFPLFPSSLNRTSPLLFTYFTFHLLYFFLLDFYDTCVLRLTPFRARPYARLSDWCVCTISTSLHMPFSGLSPQAQSCERVANSFGLFL